MKIFWLISRKTAVLIVVITTLGLLGLTGCSQKSTPLKPLYTIDNTLPNEIGDVIRQLTTATSPRKERLTLHGANLYLIQNELDKCQLLLDTLFHRELPYKLKAQYLIILSLKSIRNQQSELALQALTTNQYGLFDIIDQLNAETQLTISELRANAYESTGNFLAAARERIFFGPLLIANSTISSPKENKPIESDPIQNNNEAIWRNLMSVPKNQLSELASSAVGADYQGWLQLAYLNKAYQDDLDIQIEELNSWISYWPDHMAATHLPGFLKALHSAANSRPQHIALLLPTSGKFKRAARAIQDGFLGAHYTAQNRRQRSNENQFGTHHADQHITLSVYDTSDYPEVEDAYHQAVADGAEMVIGPLKKENVARLKQEPNLTIPVLALNYTDNEKPTSPHFFQFGLRAEDEVRQVAERAWMEGHKQAAVLFPESEWGYRVQQAFVDHWLELGGFIVTQSAFTGKNDYSNAIKLMLNIEQSEKRARKLRKLLAEKVEFNPRRRQDIDFIFLLSSSKQARQIKPTLNFHYATDLPVFATSNIYEGRIDTDRDKDINGIKFVDIPWVLTDEDSVKAESRSYWEKSSNSLQRLHALGVDAYRLIPRLQVMVAVPNGSLFGATGTLTLAENQQIKRELIWAQIKRGSPKIIPVLLDTTTNPILPPPTVKSDNDSPASISTPEASRPTLNEPALDQ